MLLPVWIMAYRYKDQVFRFLVNGQTGQATGQKPTSATKIAAAVAIGVAIILLVLLLVLACGGVLALGAARPQPPAAAVVQASPLPATTVPGRLHGSSGSSHLVGGPAAL